MRRLVLAGWLLLLTALPLAAQEDALEASRRAVLLGRHAEAAALLRDLLAREPAGPRADQARYRLAFLLQRRLDDARGAADLYREVAASGGPLAPHARLHLAECLARLGDEEGAATALGRLLEADGGHPRAEQARRAVTGERPGALPAALAPAAERLRREPPPRA
ncbi:MAG: tetratricopeptide repeat protein [Planctomycetes bacterium]|nr:tetratricopeptide repeat protein [Planctomycetota bacterium]